MFDHIDVPRRSEAAVNVHGKPSLHRDDHALVYDNPASGELDRTASDGC